MRETKHRQPTIGSGSCVWSLPEVQRQPQSQSQSQMRPLQPAEPPLGQRMGQEHPQAPTTGALLHPSCCTQGVYRPWNYVRNTTWLSQRTLSTLQETPVCDHYFSNATEILQVLVFTHLFFHIQLLRLSK